MFVLRETFRYLRHSWPAWLLQCVTLAVALAVSGLFALLAWNAHRSMAAVRANLAIEAFFDPTLSSDDAQAIAISDVAPLAGIARTEFISKEQALTDYTKESGENVEAVLGMNPLPASLKIYVDDPSSENVSRLSDRMKTLPNIEEVRSDLPTIAAMESRSRALDWAAIVLSSLLVLTAFFQSLAAARHARERRRETDRALSRMGATRWMIAAPIVYYSLLAGLAGGILGTGILFFAQRQFFSAMAGLQLERATNIMYWKLEMALVVSGIVLSVIAGLATVRKSE